MNNGCLGADLSLFDLSRLQTVLRTGTVCRSVDVIPPLMRTLRELQRNFLPLVYGHISIRAKSSAMANTNRDGPGTPRRLLRGGLA